MFLKSLGVVGAVVISAQFGSVAPVGRAHNTDPARIGGLVRVKLESIREEYCWEGAGTLPELRLDIRAAIANDTASTVLLFRGGAVIERIQVADTARQLRDADYEADISPSIIFAGASRPSIRADAFVAIPPHGVRTFHVGKVGLFVKDEEFSYVKGRGLLAPGGYVASVTLTMWPYSEELSDRWKNAMVQRGHVLTEPIASEPFRVTVASVTAVRHCPD